MEKVTTLGIDLAKSVFSLHGVDGKGQVVLRRTVRREQLVKVVAGISPCLIGMEACSGAHEWGRRVPEVGDTGGAVGPQVVGAYRESGQKERQQAEGPLRAVGPPHMRVFAVENA